MPFAALVTDREHETVRQLLLDVEDPVFVVEVFAQPVDGPRGHPRGLSYGQERLDRVGEVWHRGRGKGVIVRYGFVGRAEVVVLPGAEVNPKAGAYSGLP